MTTTDNPTRPPEWSSPGVLVTTVVGILLLAIALSVDVPRMTPGFKGDEATYYMLAKSLARDGDFAYTARDLARVWEEYSAPEGVFLKPGRTIRPRVDARFPFVHWRTRPDPDRTRLYFGKAYIYPLAAAPFVWLFGTNGFLVLNALLLTLDLWLAYRWLAARGSTPRAAALFAVVFLAASVVPVYFVWIAPEIFNLSLVMAAGFLWSYKETGSAAPGSFLASRVSDYVAAALVGVATFSKPTHVVLIVPLVLYAAWRRRWLHAFALGAIGVAVAGGLFLGNAAITGEFNYQGGERKTFYSSTGFPFANERETFGAIGDVHGRSSALLDTLVNENTLTVLRYNIRYFFVGRYSGFVPYFFPGVVALALFLVPYRSRHLWQWLLLGTLGFAALVFLFVTPFTWAGGGGAIGNRYFLSFYPLFLFLMPPVAAASPAIAALAVGALFTAKISCDPFWSSFHPGEAAKAGPLRILPIELSMLNDLPVIQQPERAKRLLSGDMLAYFPDDNAYPPEGESFWVRGRRTADVILRGPLAEQPDGRLAGRRILRLTVFVRNGVKPNRVTVDTGREGERLDLGPGEERTVTLDMPAGFPYRPYETPTSFVYVVRFSTTDGFTPVRETPPSTDARYLGAFITLTPTLE
jgi:hypothetical protein